jgi:hypothetical protein
MSTNSSICPGKSVFAVDSQLSSYTSSPSCGVPIGNENIPKYNATAILQSCCGKGAPIATYGDGPVGPSCSEYCNITQSDLNYTTASTCIMAAQRAAAPNVSFSSTCWNGKANSGTPSLQAGKASWAIGIVFIMGLVMGI